MRNSLTLALLTLGLATAAPAPLTLSGTVNAPAGTNVKGTHVIACYPKGDECDENLTVSTQITASGGSAPFSVTVKKAGKYTLIAWKDVNGTGDIDDGDYSGFLKQQPSSLTPLPVKPPASKLNVSMTVEGKAAPHAATPAAQKGAAFSGSVEAPKGVDLKGTIVLACVFRNDTCDDGGEMYTITASGQKASFTIGGLGQGPYRVLAWKDVNKNDQFDDGDYMARLENTSGAALDVQAPRANITLKLSKVGEPAGSQASKVPQASGSAAPANANPTPAIKKGEAGYVMGQVFDSQGSPVKGASVRIDPAVSGYFVHSLGTYQTDVKGMYKVRLTPEVSWKAHASVSAIWQDIPMCLPAIPYGDGALFFDRDGAVRNFKLDVNVAELRIDQQFVASTNPAERPRYIGDNRINKFRLSLRPLGAVIDGTRVQTGESTVSVSQGAWAVNSTSLNMRKLPLARYELKLSYVEQDGSLTPLVVRNMARPNAGFASSTVVEFEKISDCSASSQVEYQFP
ncbi:hypothetical protein [Deinococcus malanensis]|nr:hypothetical protein [Deinococcus malanensis]